MLLREMMTARIEEIPGDATLMQAAEKMKRLNIGAIPVREKDRLVGMITDRDIAVRAVAEGRNPKEMPVREAMSRDICFCYEDETVESAAKLMEAAAGSGRAANGRDGRDPAGIGRPGVRFFPTRSHAQNPDAPTPGPSRPPHPPALPLLT